MPPQSHNYRGLAKVHKTRTHLSYQVQLNGPDGTRYTVGTYAVPVEAATAYDLGILALRGRDNVVTNFPPDTYSDEQILEARNRLKKPTKQIKSSRFRGVCIGASGRWRSLVTVGGKQVALGTFNTEEEAAVQYDLAQLYVHACDLAAAAAHKLNMDCWATFSRQQLQELTAGVGCLITASLLEHNQPITSQQQQQQGVQPPTPIPAAACSVMAAHPVEVHGTSKHLNKKQQQQQNSQEGGCKPGKKVKALLRQQKLPAFAAAAAALAAAQHQLQSARDARKAAAGGSKSERKAAKQVLKAAKQQLEEAKEAAAAAQGALEAGLATAGKQPGPGQQQPQEGKKQGSRKRAREGQVAATAGGTSILGGPAAAATGFEGLAAPAAKGLSKSSKQRHLEQQQQQHAEPQPQPQQVLQQRAHHLSTVPGQLHLGLQELLHQKNIAEAPAKQQLPTVASQMGHVSSAGATRKQKQHLYQELKQKQQQKKQAAEELHKEGTKKKGHCSAIRHTIGAAAALSCGSVTNQQKQRYEQLNRLLQQRQEGSSKRPRW